MSGSRQRGSWRWSLPLLLGGALIAPAHAQLHASLSAASIAPGESVQLTLERSGQSSDQPDLAPLSRDFDVLGTNSSSQFEIDNGHASSTTELVLTLAPKHAGVLTIPPLNWDGQRSTALSLTVSAGATGGAGAAGTAAPKEFIQTLVDPQHPYVQAAVQVTVRVYTADTLYRPDLELPASGNVLVQQVGGDQRSATSRAGVAYQVLTRHYLLFPQRSGSLTLPGAVLDAQVAAPVGANAAGNDPFAQLFGGAAFGGLLTTRPIRVHGEPIRLQVQPRPAASTTSYWLPAQAVQLTAQWQPGNLQARAGDPVTVTLHLQALGLTAAQLPDLSALWPLPASVKVYPDQAHLQDVAQGDSVLGSRDQTIAVIADQPGRVTLPPLSVRWWDTATRQVRTAALPARVLLILPAPGGAATPAAATPAMAPATPAAGASASPRRAPATGAARPAIGLLQPAGQRRWQWLSLALGSAWLLTLGAWLWSSRRGRAARSRSRPAPAAAAGSAPASAPRPDAASARAAFRNACQAGDAPAARRALLAWAVATWPQSAPSGLDALAQRLQDPALTERLRELDRACYAGGSWQSKALAGALRELPASRARVARRRERSELSPLYP